MTTEKQALLYEAMHIIEHLHRRWVIRNPLNSPVEDLPVIYGFNNGGSHGLLQATLLAEDGTFLGGHACSAENYMPHDLGILEGCREDRHESFRKHYPEGYRMVFVGYDDVRNEKGLMKAIELNGAVDHGSD